MLGTGEDVCTEGVANRDMVCQSEELLRTSVPWLFSQPWISIHHAYSSSSAPFNLLVPVTSWPAIFRNPHGYVPQYN